MISIPRAPFPKNSVIFTTFKTAEKRIGFGWPVAISRQVRRLVLPLRRPQKSCLLSSQVANQADSSYLDPYFIRNPATQHFDCSMNCFSQPCSNLIAIADWALLRITNRGLYFQHRLGWLFLFLVPAHCFYYYGCNYLRSWECFAEQVLGHYLRSSTIFVTFFAHSLASRNPFRLTFPLQIHTRNLRHCCSLLLHSKKLPGTSQSFPANTELAEVQASRATIEQWNEIH